MSVWTRLFLAALLCAGTAACSGSEDDPDAGTADAGTADAGSADAGAGDAGAGVDTDGDGVPDHLDNCPDFWNADQRDDDGDFVGDLCDAYIDSCGFRSFEHAVGYPCNQDSDCKSGLCILGLDAQYCSTGCAVDGASTCPSGTTCTAAAGTSAVPDICVPDDISNNLAPEGSLKSGSPCMVSAECVGEGATCAGIQNDDFTYYTWCAGPCTPTGTECGACGVCEEFSGGDNYCVPSGTQDIGDECVSRHDCGTFICIGFCTQACGGANALDCPAGSTCQVINSELSICLNPNQIGSVGEGGACQLEVECAAGLRCLVNSSGDGLACVAPRILGSTCAETSECGQGLICTPDPEGGDDTCQPPGEAGAACDSDEHCAEGFDCRDFSPSLSLCSSDCTVGADCDGDATCSEVDLDAVVRIYDSPDAGTFDYVAYNDDIDYAAGNAWSHIESWEAAPGTYYLSIETFRNFLGTYRIEILDNVGTPQSFFELPGDNDSANLSQPLSAFPVVLTGVISDRDDIDFYVFTIPGTENVTVEVKTGPGNPSACLPEDLVDSTPLGGACQFNQACESALCEGRLDVCGQACEATGDCDTSGFECVDVGDHKTCVAGTTVGQTPRDTDCQFDYECTDGYCASFRFDRFCSLRCEDASCGLGSECAVLEVKDGDETLIHRACVPEGNRDRPFNAECDLQSECLADLLCDQGRCAKNCGTDAECPGQTFPYVQETETDFLCRSCDSYLDCGDDGDCLSGVGSERFCATPCSTTVLCPEGFACRGSFFGDYCEPLHGSCRKPFCAVPQGVSQGQCSVPASAYAEVCAVASECTTQLCSGGICSRSCTGDSDCSCDSGDVICSQNKCALAPYVREAEPNGEIGSPQPLSAGLPLKVYGELRPTGSEQDVDHFSVGLTGGQEVIVETRAVCGTAALGLDTEVSVYSGTTRVASDSFFDNYGTITFTPSASGQYIVKVADDGFNPQTGGYVLEIRKSSP